MPQLLSALQGRSRKADSREGRLPRLDHIPAIGDVRSRRFVLEPIRGPARHDSRGLASRQTQCPFQPVFVDDVIDALLLCLHGGASSRQTYELGGPQIYSLGEIVGLVAKITGRRRWIVGSPDAVARLQALFMDFVPGRPLLERQLSIVDGGQRLHRRRLCQAGDQAAIHGCLRPAISRRQRGQCPPQPESCRRRTRQGHPRVRPFNIR